MGTVDGMTNVVPVVLNEQLEVIPMRCTALAKWKLRGIEAGTFDGDPHCGRWAVPGLGVCKKHGGGSPQSQEASARRVEKAIERARLQLAKRLPEAVDKTVDLMRGAEDEAVQLRAAQTIMDRVGLAKVTRTEITGEVQHVVSQVDKDIEKLLGQAGAIDLPSTEVTE